jgi:hypothetical protein
MAAAERRQFSQYPRDDRVDAAQEIALGDPSAE